MHTLKLKGCSPLNLNPLLLSFLFSPPLPLRLQSTNGNQQMPTATVSMVHSVPELMVSSEVSHGLEGGWGTHTSPTRLDYWVSIDMTFCDLVKHQLIAIGDAYQSYQSVLTTWTQQGKYIFTVWKTHFHGMGKTILECMHSNGFLYTVAVLLYCVVFK